MERGRNRMFGSQVATGASLGTPVPDTRYMGKCSSHARGRCHVVTRGLVSLGMRVWVTPPSKLPRTTETLAQGERNAEWIEEDTDGEVQLQPQDQMW